MTILGLVASLGGGLEKRCAPKQVEVLLIFNFMSIHRSE